MQRTPISAGSPSFTPTDRSKVRRLPKQGSYERDLIYTILDQGLVCHVGFAIQGQPYVIPTAYARIADHIYIHGSPISRMMRSLSSGIEVCITVTLLDGLVLARSAFHHSMNYRSAIIFGTATVVSELQQKMTALQAFSEHIVPGRWSDVRHPNSSELEATVVLALPLVEASAKVRAGAPTDEREDYSLPIWAGEIPLRLVANSPINDSALSAGIDPPDYASNYLRLDNK
jgi:uncharacterized protein